MDAGLAEPLNFAWGFEARRLMLDHWQPETANPRGQISFGSGVTNIPGQVAREGNSFAAALLGLSAGYGKSIQFFDMVNREWQLAWYFRDRWQVTRRLTLNLGLRYEYFPLINRGDRGIERWDPATNIVTLGGVGNVPFNNGITVSKKLFAPRIGFAYRIGDKNVLRAGYGITYDPIPFSRPLRGLYPATLTGSWVPNVAFGWVNNIAEGIPDVPTPDISTGVLTLPVSIDMGPRSPWGGMIHRGYIQSWNFTVERKLPADFLVSVGYVGNQTVRQFLDIDINAATFVGGGPTSRPLVPTQNRLIEALMWDGWGNGNYHSMQIAINRNFSRGLFMKGAYTWSKAINLAHDDGWQGLPLTNMPSALRRNRAVAGYDRTQMFVMSWVYELPWGKGRTFNLRGFADQVFGGWRVNGIYSAYTGTPFTVSAGTASLNTPGSSQTADQIAPLKKIGDVGPGTQYYAVESFRDPNFQRPAGTFRFGTMGRNALRGPGFQKADLALFKDFSLTERFKLQFKAESFNFTNTPRFGNPAANVSNMAVNATTGAITNVNNFMAITSAEGERKFRFGLRLSF